MIVPNSVIKLINNSFQFGRASQAAHQLSELGLAFMLIYGNAFSTNTYRVFLRLLFAEYHAFGDFVHLRRFTP